MPLCPKCESNVPKGKSFCENCGTALNSMTDYPSGHMVSASGRSISLIMNNMKTYYLISAIGNGIFFSNRKHPGFIQRNFHLWPRLYFRPVSHNKYSSNDNGYHCNAEVRRKALSRCLQISESDINIRYCSLFCHRSSCYGSIKPSKSRNP